MSTRYLASNDKASGSGVHYPERRRLTQGGGDTPTVSESGHQAAFDNTQSLSSSYTDELQFVNGRPEPNRTPMPTSTTQAPRHRPHCHAGLLEFPRGTGTPPLFMT